MNMGAGWFATGAALCGLGVLLGAFGAHGLRDRLTMDMLAVYETGVRYHLTHALGLLAVAWGDVTLAQRLDRVGGLAVRGRHRPLLRESLSARRDRCPLARGDHAHRRVLSGRRLGRTGRGRGPWRAVMATVQSTGASRKLPPMVPVAGSGPVKK